MRTRSCSSIANHKNRRISRLERPTQAEVVVAQWKTFDECIHSHQNENPNTHLGLLLLSKGYFRAPLLDKLEQAGHNLTHITRPVKTLIFCWFKYEDISSSIEVI